MYTRYYVLQRMLFSSVQIFNFYESVEKLFSNITTFFNLFDITPLYPHLMVNIHCEKAIPTTHG